MSMVDTHPKTIVHHKRTMIKYQPGKQDQWWKIMEGFHTEKKVHQYEKTTTGYQHEKCHHQVKILVNNHPEKAMAVHRKGKLIQKRGIGSQVNLTESLLYSTKGSWTPQDVIGLQVVVGHMISHAVMVTKRPGQVKENHMKFLETPEVNTWHLRKKKLLHPGTYLQAKHPAPIPPRIRPRKQQWFQKTRTKVKLQKLWKNEERLQIDMKVVHQQIIGKHLAIIMISSRTTSSSGGAGSLREAPMNHQCPQGLKTKMILQK